MPKAFKQPAVTGPTGTQCYLAVGAAVTCAGPVTVAHGYHLCERHGHLLAVIIADAAAGVRGSMRTPVVRKRTRGPLGEDRSEYKRFARRKREQARPHSTGATP